MERIWGNWEELEKEWGIGARDKKNFISIFPSFCCETLKNFTFCHKTLKYVTFCRQMFKYGTFCRKCRKILTYSLWGNDSGSIRMGGSPASCAGLVRIKNIGYWCEFWSELCYLVHEKFPPWSSSCFQFSIQITTVTIPK